MLHRNLLQMRFLTSWGGEYMGKDTHGNKYYQQKLLFGKPSGILRRWVMYNDKKGVEPSTVGPLWFGWLHFTAEDPLEENVSYSWGRPFQGNKAGSTYAYQPTQPSKTLKFSNNLEDIYYTPWSPKRIKHKI